MRLIKNPEERRNEILNAAEILFVTKGYTKATVMDILQACNIAKGTFYYYFQSKEEVMNAIVMRYILNGESAARRIVSDPELSAHDKIFRIITAQNQPDDRKHGLIEQLHHVQNVEMHQKSLVETVIRLSPILAEVVEQGIQEGVFNTPSPKESIEFLLVSSQFLLDQGIFQWEEEELRKKVETFSHIMERVLGAKQGSFAYFTRLHFPHQA
ncbi:TetR/AcrR family transcriptional regulator [Paenibacillus xylanilyticus]|uniref:TetR/AcrR family transcriptional regulator n=1 Tax=Paenibacillus xylanilyticus TaxID=248903 RepID=A0A7Y6BZH9_9BACL|nr:TetR/AcrR family transcriptional regulator [Paenibacillus xylanilyticus]NUU77803.1 TetR/AcrR family transcriptional regulator [Paenibacillus xylanilyticus]